MKINLPSPCEHCSTSAFKEIYHKQFFKHPMVFYEGETLFEEGEKANGIYCISSGLQLISKKNQDKIDFFLDISRKGDMQGFQGLLSEEGRHLISCRALSETNTCFIPSKVFFNMIQENSSLSLYFMKYLCYQIEYMEDRARDYINLNEPERIQKIIQRLRGKIQDNNLSLSLSLLSSLVGISKEKLENLLGDLLNKQASQQLS